MLVIVKAFCTTLYTTVNKKAWINRNFIKYIVSNLIWYDIGKYVYYDQKNIPIKQKCNGH